MWKLLRQPVRPPPPPSPEASPALSPEPPPYSPVRVGAFVVLILGVIAALVAVQYVVSFPGCRSKNDDKPAPASSGPSVDCAGCPERCRREGKEVLTCYEGLGCRCGGPLRLSAAPSSAPPRPPPDPNVVPERSLPTSEDSCRTLVGWIVECQVLTSVIDPSESAKARWRENAEQQCAGMESPLLPKALEHCRRIACGTDGETLRACVPAYIDANGPRSIAQPDGPCARLSSWIGACVTSSHVGEGDLPEVRAELVRAALQSCEEEDRDVVADALTACRSAECGADGETLKACVLDYARTHRELPESEAGSSAD